MPSLVVTIGTQFLFRGLTLVLVAGQVSYALVETRGDPAYGLLVGKPLRDPDGVLVAGVGMTVAAWVLLNRHRLGQNTYVIGDNRQAARLMGIPIRRTRIVALRADRPGRRAGRADEQPPGRQLLSEHGRRLPAADARRGVRGRHVGVRRPGQHLRARSSARS